MESKPVAEGKAAGSLRIILGEDARSVIVRNPKPSWYISLLRDFLRELWWLVVGRPKQIHRGTWVYNDRDHTWRYYVKDFS